ncbi:MAG: hypothetical protein J6X49_00490, partial [Victivallales bacterium]|nr:hypothetical protein [Victivallales bacterium]
MKKNRPPDGGIVFARPSSPRSRRRPACARLTATRSALALGRDVLGSCGEDDFWLSEDSLIELEQGRGET